MPTDTVRRWRMPLSVAGVTAIWVAANAVWLVRHRGSQPLNIDEAGYIGIATNYAYGWERGGLAGWLEAVFAPSMHAPLTTAITSLAELSGWDHRVVAFGVILAFATVTVAATAALALTIGSRTTVVMAVLLLLSAPGFVALSRNYVFAVPAAAVTMLALFALRRSRWLTSSGWSAVFGVAVGMMPLARTMMISFVPVLLAVAVVHALGHRSSGRRQALNTLLAGGLAVVVAASWLLPSARLVFGYLTEYGYGKHSADYGDGTIPAPVRVLGTFGQDFFLPHLILIGVGWTLLALPYLQRVRGQRLKRMFLDATAAPVFPCIGLVLGASVVLMTSQNAGFGFTLPLLAPATVAAAVGWTRALGSLSAPAARRAGFAVLGLACLLVMVPSFDQSSWLARPRDVDVMGARISVTNGMHTDSAYIFARTDTSSIAADVPRNSPAWADDWNRAGDQIVDELLDNSTARPNFAFGFRNRFANVNTAQLEVLERLHYGVRVAQIDPRKDGHSRADYEHWLTRGSARTSCQLLLSEGAANEFPPRPLTANLRAAARHVGFSPVTTIALPDGREVELWERAGRGCR